MIKVKITGDREVIRAMEKAKKAMRQALAAAIYQEGLAIMAKSVRQVPVDTGRLRGSHYVKPPSNDRKPVATLGYGVDYALPVHERVGVSHVTGNAKFLEGPIKAARSGYKARLAKRAKENFESGTTVGGVSSSTPTKGSS